MVNFLDFKFRPVEKQQMSCLDRESSRSMNMFFKTEFVFQASYIQSVRLWRGQLKMLFEAVFVVDILVHLVHYM